MMQGASDIETGALVLTMNENDLESFVATLRRGSPAEVALSASPPREATHPVDRLRLQPEKAGPLLIRVDGRSATISGSRENFALWVSDLEEFQTENDLEEPGMHVHFDPAEPRYHGFEFSGDSAELIIAGPVPDEA